MSNVIPIDRKRRTAATIISGHDIVVEVREALRDVLPAKPAHTVVSPLLDDLEEASSEYLLNKLKLKHKRERLERELVQLEADNDLNLEEAAYFAHLNGVPESEIYELDAFSGQALENAIRKVQAHA